MAKNERRITSFQELGAAFGIKSPSTQGVRDEQTDFYRLSPLEKVRLVSSSEEKIRNKPERYERKAAAVMSVLSMSAEERAKQQLKVIILTGSDSEKISYHNENKVHVFIVFPANRAGSPRLLSIWDSHLRRFEDVSQDFILSHGDEMREETLADRQRRTLFNIKGLNAAIADQKRYVHGQKYTRNYAPLEIQVNTRNVTEEMERLNRLKTLLTRDFLETSLQLERENSHLQPLFLVSPSSDGRLHRELQMWDTREKTLLQRIINKNTPQVLVDTNGAMFATNMNMQVLEQSSKQFYEESIVPEHVKAGHEIYQLITSEAITKRIRRKQIEAPQIPTPQEISPEMTNFIALPLEQKLIQAFSRLVPTAQGEKPKAIKEKFLAMKEAIELSKEEREEKGMKVIAIVPVDESNTFALEDPDNTQYPVFVIFKHNGGNKFLSATRGELAGDPLGPKLLPTRDELLAFDDLLMQNGVELIVEQEGDRYQRHLKELMVLGKLQYEINEERKNKGVGQYRELTNELQKVQQKKAILLFSLVEGARILKREHPLLELVYVAAHPEYDDLVTFTLFDIVQKNTISFFLGNGIREIQKTEKVFKTNTSLPALYEQKKIFDSGDDTEESGTAVALLDFLESTGVLGPNKL